MTYRWAIASTGDIAGSFADSLMQVPDAELVAVGSRTGESAGRFADAHDVPRWHGSIEALAADPDVDIVYIAGIHPVHRDHAVAMMEAGKHVLVEKPLAMTVAEVDAMLDASERTGRFLMEAMWMRFNPLHVELKRRLDAGEFGEVRSIESDFSFDRPFDPAHRLFNPAKGGGALLDVGVYPLSLAWWWMGRPDHSAVSGTRGETRVDESVTMRLRWGSGARANLTCGIRRAGSMETHICCDNVEIVIPAPSHASNRATVKRGEAVEAVECESASLHHQVLEVHRCVELGVRESPRMSHRESRDVTEFMEHALTRI